jgi:hypothetical protein
MERKILTDPPELDPTRRITTDAPSEADPQGSVRPNVEVPLKGPPILSDPKPEGEILKG